MRVGDIVDVPVKPWFRSVTLWIQALSIGLLVVGLIVEQAHVYDLDSRAIATLGIVSALLTAIRRVVSTVQPIDGSSDLTIQALTVTNADGTAST